MTRAPIRIAPLALIALPLLLGFGCSGSEPDGGLPPGTSGGNSSRAGSSNQSGTSSTAGTNSTAGSTTAGAGGTSQGSGGSPASGGASTTAGSGGSGAYSTVACEGLPYTPGEGGDGGEDACVGVGSEAEPVPVDLFIMMDRSQSLGQEIEETGQIRWEALREAVQAFVDAASEDDIRAGIGFFGRTGGNDDVLDCDSSYYAEPEVGIAPIADVGSDLVGAMEDTFPGGLTPTAPALTGALQYAASFAEDNPGRATFVVLVTDGYPTQCDPNSVSAISEIAETAHLMEPYVRTYVIGLAAEFNLDNIAVAGGTHQAFLVDAANVTDSFVNALRNVSNTRLACEYVIPPPPSGTQLVDHDEVQVTYTTAEEETEEIPRIANLEACARNPNGGWYYDDPNDPTRIKVCPCTCTRFQAGRVDVRLGCRPKVGLR
jgi:hypothetical protein